MTIAIPETSTVLVPLDGTCLAEQALPTALSVARRRHGRLELILVRNAKQQRYGLEDWPWALGSPATSDAYVADKARTWSETLGSAVGHASVDGDAARAICRRAHELAADLIVMSTHARTGFARLLAGSVADAVVRQSRVPVLLLRPPAAERRAPRTALHVQRILIPLDESLAARQVFDPACALAEPGVTELLLLHVVGLVGQRSATQLLVDAADRKLEAVATDLAARSGCDVYPHVITGDDTARAINSFAYQYNASLVAMTTSGRGASRLFLGSVADGVLRKGTCPLLVVRPR